MGMEMQLMDQAEHSAADVVISWVIVGTLMLLVGWAVYSLFSYTEQQKQSARSQFYRNCFDRGGSITETPYTYECVGIKEPKK